MAKSWNDINWLSKKKDKLLKTGKFRKISASVLQITDFHIIPFILHKHSSGKTSYTKGRPTTICLAGLNQKMQILSLII